MNNILKARERRYAVHLELLKAIPNILTISLTPPGNRKNTAAYEKYFRYAVNYLEKVFYGKISELDHIIDEAGYQKIYKFDRIGPLKLKLSLVKLESLYIFSIIDMDILSNDGEFKRSAIGLPPRKCIVCNRGSSKACSTGNKHNITEIRTEYFKVMKRIKGIPEVKKKLGNLIRTSLMAELATTPKPGMVDLLGRGIHSDMDLSTFTLSAELLALRLPDLFKAGTMYPGVRRGLLKIIREEGLKVEKKMFKATKGINTHKGALFIFSIILFSLGQLWVEKKNVSRSLLEQRIKLIAKRLTEELKDSDLMSTSALMYRQYGITGIRGEMENGLSSVWRVLDEDISSFSMNELLLRRFLMLFAFTEDTQAYKKVPGDILDKMKRNLDPKGRNLEKEIGIFRNAVEKWSFSAGGTADLLATSIFLENVFKLTK